MFLKVDKTKCSDCVLCNKVCAFNDDYDKSLTRIATVFILLVELHNHTLLYANYT